MTTMIVTGQHRGEVLTVSAIHDSPYGAWADASNALTKQFGTHKWQFISSRILGDAFALASLGRAEAKEARWKAQGCPQRPLPSPVKAQRRKPWEPLPQGKPGAFSEVCKKIDRFFQRALGSDYGHSKTLERW